MFTCAGRLSFNDGQFHVLDFDSHKKEIDLANYGILQVIPERELLLRESFKYAERGEEIVCKMMCKSVKQLSWLPLAVG